MRWIPSIAVVALACCGGRVEPPSPMATRQAARAIAIDEGAVYWTDGDFTNGSHRGPMACARKGCTAPRELAQPTSSLGLTIAVDATHVYWGDTPNGSSVPSHVWACPKAGCNGDPTAIYAGPLGPIALAVDETNVYWVGNAFQVSSCPKTGCNGEPEFVVPTKAPSEHIALDETSLVWAEADAIHWKLGRVLICDKAECGLTETVLAEGDRIGPIALDAANVYWIRSASDSAPGAILRCARSGCDGKPTVLATDAAPKSIAVRRGRVFWTGESGVLSVPIAGGASTAISTNQIGADLLAVDDTDVFWAVHGSNFYRTPL